MFSLIPIHPSPSVKPTNQPNQLGSKVVLNFLEYSLLNLSKDNCEIYLSWHVSS